MIKLFVYGTLKKGYGNHYRLDLGKARFIGAAVSKGAGYRMHNAGFPILSDHPLGARVTGELYEVDRATLHSCDRLERHPEWYRRRKRKFVAEDGTEHKAWVYVMPAKLAEHRPVPNCGLLSWPFKEDADSWYAARHTDDDDDYERAAEDAARQNDAHEGFEEDWNE